MLTPFDDFPYHQIPYGFEHAGSSDYRWFDRYWFVAYDPTGQVAVASGLGLYKNMNVLDGFGCVVAEGIQHNVRVSRRLRPDLETIGAGPLHYEVVKGMKQFRLALEDNDHGLCFDLTWTGDTPPHLEDHHFVRSGGVVQEDYDRFLQFGTVTGQVSVGARVYECADGWFGFRDRSYGVRPGVGGPTPTAAPTAELASMARATFLVGFGFNVEGTVGVWQVMEDADGNVVYFDGHMFPDGDPAKQIKLVAVEHDVELIPGTASFQKVSAVLHTERGDRLAFEGEPLCGPFVYQGFGYFDGYHDRQGLGAYRGDLHVEGERYDVSDPAHIVDTSGGREFPPRFPLEYSARVTLDGRRGISDSAVFLIGPHPRYNP